MKNNHCIAAGRMTIVAAALATAFGSAVAADDTVYRLVQPESSVRLGLGYLTEDAARFGQYRGLVDSGAYGIADVHYLSRDSSNGRWLKLDGRNLGLDSRSLRFEHSVQGSWKYFFEYDQLSRYSQYTFNTALQGFGTDVLLVGAVSDVKRDKRIKSDRETFGAGGQYWISDRLDLQVKYRHETKDGTRLSGFFASPQYIIAEPVEHTMQQLDVILGYSGEKFQLTGGYYGSYFENDNSALSVRTAAAPTVEIAGLAGIALPPDNYAHQFHLAGGYSFTPTARANFKLAKTFAYQNDSFINTSIPGRSNLGGRLETTLAQVGFTARPFQKLTLVADYRQEERDDQTPQAAYFTSNTTFNGLNEKRDYKTATGKFEARYLLPAGFRLSGHVEVDEKNRDVDAMRRLVAARKRTNETTYRVELSKSMSDTLTGALAVVQSERTGSQIFADTRVTTGTQAARYNIPVHIADRDREKIRLSLDWMPLERLSVQVVGEIADDNYKNNAFGPDKGKSNFWSVDGAYSLTDDWQVYAWASRELLNLVNRQNTLASNAVSGDWVADLSTSTEAFGLGLRGNLGSNWKVGGDVQYSHNLSKYGQTGTPVTTELNDVKFTGTTFKLFAEYAMKRDLSLRFDAIHDVLTSNDWLWTNAVNGSFVTSNLYNSNRDGVTQDNSQETTFVGVSMRYKWR